LLVMGVAILLWLAPYFTKINEAKILLPIAAFMLVFDSLRNFSFAQSRAREKMQLESFNEIITNIVITGLGFYFLKFYPGSKGLTIAYAIGTAIGFFAIILSIRHHLKNLWANFDCRLIKTILSASLPFALASFLGAIMINTDLIMLSWMRSPDELGFYSAAQKPIQLLYVMANLFAAAMFPVLSKAALNKERFRNLLEKSLSASLLVALPLSISSILLAKQIIIFLFGPVYAPAILAFQILLVTLLIIFPSVIISNSILAYNKQKNFIIFSALGAIGNVFFNFLLIPYWGIAGAATSTIFTMIISNTFIWIKMRSLNDFNILGRIKKIIISTILITPIIILLKYFDVNLIANITLTTIAYFVLLKIQKEETVINLFKKISAG
ncbi:MAG: polysaccharide biosynthesis protein, partial [Parcubacteria group bacterium Athens0714_26]